MSKLTGFVLWTDHLSKEGIIRCLDNERDYYFNEWSLPRTIYKSTGSRLFPGLFRDRHTETDPTFFELKPDQGVEFEQFQNDAWAIDVSAREDLADEVASYRLTCVLESIDSVSADPRKWYRNIWLPHYERRLEKLLEAA